jgi:hypothetical protein
VNAATNNRDVNIVANQILNEINKDVGNQVKNRTRVLGDVTDGIMDELLKRDITNSITRRSKVKKVANNKAAANNKAPVNDIMNQMLKKDITNKINVMNDVNITDDVINELMKDIKNEINNQVTVKNAKNNNKNVEFVANKILNQLTNEVKTEIRKGGRAAEPNSNNKKPIYNSNSNSNNKKPIYNSNSNSNSNNKKPNYNSNSNNNVNNKKINNPLFKPNMKNNPLFNSPKKNNNRKTESNQLSKYINNLGLKGNNKKKLMNLFNTTNQSLEAAKQNASTLSNTRKLQNSVVNEKNFNKERNTLQNKITKELNLRPNNNGVFRERKGLTKGRIGVWAQELRKAETIDDLKAIEDTLNEKVELRKNIENKYTKMGLTNQSEKARHRNAVVKFKNNANARRKEIEEYLTKTPTLMNKGSYQSKVNRLQREFPKGTSPATRRNWMKKSRIYTGRIQKASQYGDMIKAYNNAMKSFKNLSK